MKRNLAIILAYVALTVVMTWPYVSYRHFGSAIYGGDARLILWTLAWDNHAVLTGTPLFDSNIFYPAAHSLQYNEHLFGVSLFTLPWAALGASPVLAYNATWWLGFLANGLATCAFLHRVTARAYGTGIGVLPAFAGSLVFLWSFYVMSHAHGHLHLVWLWPIPLSLLLFERWWDEPSLGRAVVWTLVMLLGVLTSWYMAVMVALVNGLALMAVWLGTRSTVAGSVGATSWRTRLSHLVLAGVLLGTGVFPFARHYVGMRAEEGEASAFAADLASYLVPPQNTLIGRWWTGHLNGRPREIWGEQTLFVGWVAPAVALIGLLGRHGRRRNAADDASRRASQDGLGAMAPWFFLALVIVGFLLSLGPTPSLLGGSALAPFHWLSRLPGFNGMRAAARFALVVTFGLAGLSALGAARLVSTGGGRRRSMVLALIPLMLLEWFVVDFPAGAPTPDPIPAIYRAPQLRTARALVSLPEYRQTAEWFRGGDYLYYSTVHWRPIVNGFGRTEPPMHDALMRTISDFPRTADEMRHRGIQFVVVHGGRFEDLGDALVARTRAHAGVRLIAQAGTDYLFELIDAK